MFSGYEWQGKGSGKVSDQVRLFRCCKGEKHEDVIMLHRSKPRVTRHFSVQNAIRLRKERDAGREGTTYIVEGLA